MTIKVKYQNGVFEPVTSTQDIQIEEGTELEIQILSPNQKSKLKGIIGLFEDLSEQEIVKFEEEAKRRQLFDIAEKND